MPELYFKIGYVILWVVYVALRVPHDNIYKKQEIVVKLGYKGEKFVMFIAFIGMVLIPFIWAFTNWFSGLKIAVPVWVNFVGIALAIASLFYFKRVHRALNINWSPLLEIRKEHELIKTGPYRKIRHPMYLQIWIWTIAQIFIITNWAAGFSALLSWALLYFMRINREEKMLIDQFGDEYLDYMKKTGRVFPKLK